jgi:uncharacterized Tic20 family protein
LVDYEKGKGLPPVEGLRPFMSRIVLKNKSDNINNIASSMTLDTNKSYNYASILHLSGLAIVTGIPFINIVIPTCLWLAKKEDDPIIDLHGRAVINFQITITILQLVLLSLGTLLVWFTPGFIKELLDATRTIKIVFSTAYYLPFNLFTFLPFIFATLIGIIGAIAAYHGTIAPSLFGFKFLAMDFALEEPNQPEPPQPTTQADNKTKAQTNKRASFG